jgi:hypothetical protein
MVITEKENQEMEARTAFGGGRISAAGVVTFIVALLAGFLLGGAGGYLLRSPSSPASSTIAKPAIVPQSNQTRQPAVLPDWAYHVQPQPTMPQETLDPAGNVIHY